MPQRPPARPEPSPGRPPGSRAHGGGHRTWTCRVCDETVYGPPLNTHYTTLEGPANRAHLQPPRLNDLLPNPARHQPPRWRAEPADPLPEWRHARPRRNPRLPPSVSRAWRWAHHLDLPQLGETVYTPVFSDQ